MSDLSLRAMMLAIQAIKLEIKSLEKCLAEGEPVDELLLQYDLALDEFRPLYEEALKGVINFPDYDSICP